MHAHPRSRFHRFQRPASLIAVLALASLTGACANSASQLLEMASVKPASASDVSSAPQTELERATEYWQTKFRENPQDLNAALSYARNLKAGDNKREALAVLQQASLFHGQDRELASEYGRLALDLGQVQLAAQALAAADNPAKPDWKVISARGAVFAKLEQFPTAIEYLERARALKPNTPSIENNLAMAYVAVGELVKAEALLQNIAFRPDSTPRMRQNLSLVLGLLGRYTEAKAIAAQDGSDQEAYARIDRIKAMGKANRDGIRGSTEPSRGYVGATTAMQQ